MNGKINKEPSTFSDSIILNIKEKMWL